MTIIMKMTLVPLLSLSVGTKTCTQELLTCMVMIICTLVSGVSRKGKCGLSSYSLQPNHLSFTTTFLFMYLLIVHHFWNCKTPFFPSSICGPILHIRRARAVDLILSLALLYMNRLIVTPQAYVVFMSVHNLHHLGIRVKGLFF